MIPCIRGCSPFSIAILTSSIDGGATADDVLNDPNHSPSSILVVHVPEKKMGLMGGRLIVELQPFVELRFGSLIVPPVIVKFA